MADYSFFSIWELRAPIDDVWKEISQSTSYAEWFPHVAESKLISMGDETGVGAITSTRWTSALPYSLVFTTRTDRVERPHLIELTSTGDLEGTGRWDLSANGDVTAVRYDWNVRTTKQWMDLIAPLARPAFGWNHAVIMRAGGEGLAARLGAELVRNQSFTEESANPLVPISATAGLLALLILGANMLRRALSRS
ncbi:MAG TPA: SRPBCC family protein [Nitrolancea sp.]|jgi:uncharacterized protein YndB with AHSA1/START domain|nr:SRPBCC family protein [Nitrolancea sp.]